MPAWLDNTASTGALDALLATITNRVGTGEVHLVTDFTEGESYATVIGRSCGSASITAGDFSGPTSDGHNRILTFNGKAGTATQDATGPHDLHIVFTNGSDTLLAISDETSDQNIVNGNAINFPVIEIRALQPTSAA
jgi:hypothetical protein